MIDLLVVGGGPAGLATALYARRAGLDVAVIEQRPGPVDKACGEGLMPGAVAALSDLGVRLDGRPFRGIRYTDGTRSAEAHFRSGTGIGVRRTTLHAALAERVESADIPVHHRAVTGVQQRADSITAGGLTARYLAAADGLHSRLRDAAGLAARPARLHRFGLRRHYAVEPWTDLVEVHWSPRAEAYVTPVEDGLVGVAVLTADRAPFDEHLRAFPALAARLRVDGSGAVRGAGPLLQPVRGRVAGRVLLVGDAAGYVDALTGEGIAVAIACARALVVAVAADRPQDYDAAWLRASRRYRWLTSGLLYARRLPVVPRLVVPAAARLPRVFAGIVNQLAR